RWHVTIFINNDPLVQAGPFSNIRKAKAKAVEGWVLLRLTDFRMNYVHGKVFGVALEQFRQAYAAARDFCQEGPAALHDWAEENGLLRELCRDIVTPGRYARVNEREWPPGWNLLLEREKLTMD